MSSTGHLSLSLGSPVPRRVDLSYEEAEYATRGNPVYLPLPDEHEIRFFDVLQHRRTRRNFESISLEQLGTLLWYTGKTLGTAGSRVTIERWEHRTSPSAGGRHPVDIIVLSPDLVEDLSAFLYNTYSHSLELLDIAPERLGDKWAELDKIVPLGAGTVICHFAQPGRTLAKYEDGESLVWRDAGCLVAVTALIAEALELSCCPLGITAPHFFPNIRVRKGTLQPVGACIVGGRGRAEYPTEKRQS